MRRLKIFLVRWVNTSMNIRDKNKLPEVVTIAGKIKTRQNAAGELHILKTYKKTLLWGATISVRKAADIQGQLQKKIFSLLYIMM